MRVSFVVLERADLVGHTIVAGAEGEQSALHARRDHHLMNESLALVDRAEDIAAADTRTALSRGFEMPHLFAVKSRRDYAARKV